MLFSQQLPNCRIPPPPPFFFFGYCVHCWLYNHITNCTKSAQSWITCSSVVWLNVDCHSTWTVMKQILLTGEFTHHTFAYWQKDHGNACVLWWRSVAHGEAGRQYNTQQHTTAYISYSAATQTFCETGKTQHTPEPDQASLCMPIPLLEDTF
jgi:hypothetical protein